MGFGALSPETVLDVSSGVPEDGRAAMVQWRVDIVLRVGDRLDEGLAEVRELAATAGIRAQAGWVGVKEGHGTETELDDLREGITLDTTEVGEHELAAQEVSDLVYTEDLTAIKTPADEATGIIDDNLHVVEIAELADLDGDEEVESSVIAGEAGERVDLGLTSIADIDAIVGEVVGEDETVSIRLASAIDIGIEHLENTGGETNIIASIALKLLGEGVVLGLEGTGAGEELDDKAARALDWDGLLGVDKILHVVGVWVVGLANSGIYVAPGVKEASLAARGQDSTVSSDLGILIICPGGIVAAEDGVRSVEIEVSEVITTAFLVQASAAIRGAARGGAGAAGIVADIAIEAIGAAAAIDTAWLLASSTLLNSGLSSGYSSITSRDEKGRVAVNDLSDGSLSKDLGFLGLHGQEGSEEHK